MKETGAWLRTTISGVKVNKVICEHHITVLYTFYTPATLWPCAQYVIRHYGTVQYV